MNAKERPVRSCFNDAGGIQGVEWVHSSNAAERHMTTVHASLRDARASRDQRVG